MANKSNVTVKARQGESAERMIKRFMKLTKKFKILEQVRDRRYFKKPSDKKRLHKQKVARDMAKDLAKKREKEKYV
jgi:small subunit ribosomal protein S21